MVEVEFTVILDATPSANAYDLKARPVVSPWDMPIAVLDYTGSTPSGSFQNSFTEAIGHIPQSARDLCEEWTQSPWADGRYVKLSWACGATADKSSVASERLGLYVERAGGSAISLNWGGYYSTDRIVMRVTSTSTFVHEYGHHVDKTKGSATIFDAELVEQIAKSFALKQSWESSYYGFTNSAEWFAEVWTAQLLPGYLGSGNVGSYRIFYSLCGSNSEVAGTVRAIFLDYFPDMPPFGWYTSNLNNVVMPTITGRSFPVSLYQGDEFTYAPLNETNSALPATWSIPTGSLPSGLSLNASTGAITGTPTAAGAYSFTLRATNANGSIDRSYSGRIFTRSVDAPVIDTSVTLRYVSGGRIYGQTEDGASIANTSFLDMDPVQLTATGDTPITCIAELYDVNYDLPNGISLSADGLLSGRPTTLTTATVRVYAENAGGRTSADLAFEVLNGPSFNTFSVGDFVVGAARSVNINGVSPVTGWRISKGAIPEGMTLSKTGTVRWTLSGTPTTAGPYSFVMEQSNEYGYERFRYEGVVSAA